MDYGYFYHLFHFKILYTKQNKYLTKKPVGIHSSGRLIQIINLAFNSCVYFNMAMAAIENQ